MRFNENLKRVKVYEAGKPIELVVREFGVKKEDVVKLASNENPYGLSPLAKEAIINSASKVNLYPDDSMYELKDGLAKKFGVLPKEIIIGAGSDQVIDFAIKSKCNDGSGKIITAKTTFAMYEIYAKQIGAKVIKSDSRLHNLDYFYKKYEENKDADIIFLCLPNNPLGEALPKSMIYSFLDKISHETLVVFDGAYQEYSKYKDLDYYVNPKELIEKYPNCLYLGTFSKAYGLGGMRVGYGIAKEEIIENLYKLRPPFNITTLSLQAAIAALKDDDFVNESVKKNFEQMKRYEDFIDGMKYEYIPSYTNFITFLFPDNIDAQVVCRKLLQKGVIVRDLFSYEMNSMRVTIGTKEQNDRFFEEFDKLGLS